MSRCGESHSEGVQLAVIRALLTITTAEHFVVHGDSLLQAVRTVFNVAIGSDSADIQQTARSALLQMLNTVVKRVTTYHLVRCCCVFVHVCFARLPLYNCVASDKMLSLTRLRQQCLQISLTATLLASHFVPMFLLALQTLRLPC